MHVEPIHPMEEPGRKVLDNNFQLSNFLCSQHSLGTRPEHRDINPETLSMKKCDRYPKSLCDSIQIPRGRKHHTMFIFRQCLPADTRIHRQREIAK